MFRISRLAASSLALFEFCAASAGAVEPIVIGDSLLNPRSTTIGGASVLPTTRTVEHWFGQTQDQPVHKSLGRIVFSDVERYRSSHVEPSLPACEIHYQLVYGPHVPVNSMKPEVVDAPIEGRTELVLEQMKLFSERAGSSLTNVLV